WADELLFRATICGKLLELFHSHVARSPKIAAAHAASACELLNAGVNHPTPEAVLEPLMEVANLPEFLFDPAVIDFLLVGTQCGSRKIVLPQSCECGFRCHHSALDCQMDPLQPL